LNPERLAEYFSEAPLELRLGVFLLDALIVAVCAGLLSRIYVRCGRSVSNRSSFAGNFVVLAVTTLLVISVVRSSLALSLGLVGALSIVRFRAAIKEPEELTYLFIAIALGLGVGGGQRAITLAAFVLLVAILLLRHALGSASRLESMHLLVAQTQPEATTLEQIVAVLDPHCDRVRLKRIDESEARFEALFEVELRDLAALTACRQGLRGLPGAVELSLLERALP
jgi:hypothetical protein